MINKILNAAIITASVLALLFIALVLWSRRYSKAELEVKVLLTPSEDPQSFQIQGIYSHSFNGDSIILLNENLKERNSEKGYIIYYKKNYPYEPEKKVGLWILNRAENSVIGTSGYRLMFYLKDSTSGVNSISFKLYDDTKVKLEIIRLSESNQIIHDVFFKSEIINEKTYQKYRSLIALNLHNDSTLFSYLEYKKLKYDSLASVLDSSKYLKKVLEDLAN